MTPTETATILRQFNDWRRGDEDIPQFDPREIGEAIDAAIAMIDRLEAMEKDIALKERIIDSLGSELNAVSNERDALRAKIEAMEQQKPAGTLHDDGCFVWSTPRPYDSNYAGWKMKLYLAPGAQPAPVDDSATIAGLESAVTHLSVLLDSFRALLVEVNDVCGRDGHGGQLEDGESEIIDKVRAAISMTEAPPLRKRRREMKLSEKIQEALRQQQEINLSDPAVQKRLAAQWGYVPADAQPAPDDEYVGWYCAHCQRGVDASEVTCHEQHEACGRVITDDRPPKPTSNIPEGWLRAVDEALVTAHIGVANESDTYEQAKAKLDNLIGFHVEVATDPAVNGGWKLVPIEPTPGMIDAAEYVDWGDADVRGSCINAWDRMLAAAPEAKP